MGKDLSWASLLYELAHLTEIGRGAGDVAEAVSMGLPPSSALALSRAGTKLPPAAAALVAAAERSGGFQRALRDASLAIADEALRRKSSSACFAYPLALLIALGSAAALLTWVVAPQLHGAYVSFSIDPPRHIEVLAGIGKALQNARAAPSAPAWGTAAAGCILGAFVGFGRRLRLQAHLLERLAWAFPMVGRATRRRSGSTLIRWFSRLLASGTEPAEALSLAGRCSGSVHLRRRTEALIADLESGVSLEDCLQAVELVPPEAVAAVRRAGNAEQWRRAAFGIASVHDRMADAEERIGYALIEPICIVVLGIGVLMLGLVFVTALSELASEVVTT